MTTKTRLSAPAVEKTAAGHDTVAEEIDLTNLSNLKKHVDTVLSTSQSQATRALQVVMDDWIDSVRKIVLGRMRDMSAQIRSAASGTTDFDATNKQTISSLPIETGKFLSA